MNTITIQSANKQFCGEIKAGQFVCFWISQDSQNSMAMTYGSHESEQQAMEDAQAEGERQGIEDGTYEVHLVVDEQ